MNRRFGAAAVGAIVTALVLTTTAPVGAGGNVAATGTEVSALSTTTYGPVLVWTGKLAASGEDAFYGGNLVDSPSTSSVATPMASLAATSRRSRTVMTRLRARLSRLVAPAH